jgi:hypothetical protein
MKYVFVVLLLAITTGLSAQHLADNFSAVSYGPLNLQEPSAIHMKSVDYLPGERMRNTGRTLTILGAGLFVGGIAVYSSADSPGYTKTYTSNGSYEQGDPKAAYGILMITGGAGMMVPGIIFWSKGSKKYKAAAKGDVPVASVHLRRNGVGVRYSF